MHNPTTNNDIKCALTVYNCSLRNTVSSVVWADVFGNGVSCTVPISNGIMLHFTV